jgi:hypothetical protein
MVEKNLEQMINVLRLRLSSINEAATKRKEYCIHDLKPNSRLESKQLPGIAADYDEFIPKNSTKESAAKNAYVGGHKEANLVSTEGVFVDSLKLGKRLDFEFVAYMSTSNNSHLYMFCHSCLCSPQDKELDRGS